jgi:hypothetical protein
MSEAAAETATDTTGGSTTSGETPAADEFKPITSQDDLNKVISERVARERAKFKDYADLKAKAAKADQYEQANQTEAEKTAKRIADLEAELNNTRRDSLRLKIASTHGITDAEDIELFLTGTDEETLTAQAKRLSDRAAEQQQLEADRKKKNPSVPKEGTSTKPGTTTEEDDLAFARTFFTGGSA